MMCKRGCSPREYTLRSLRLCTYLACLPLMALMHFFLSVAAAVFAFCTHRAEGIAKTEPKEYTYEHVREFINQFSDSDFYHRFRTY